jgi:hypothetical protein
MDHRAAGGGGHRGPTASALLRAVERELDHLARAARNGALEDLVPLAIPHGPLLANLQALYQGLRNSAAPTGVAGPPRPAATFTPITVALAGSAVGLPQRTLPERVARARSASAAPPPLPGARRPPAASNR